MLLRNPPTGPSMTADELIQRLSPHSSNLWCRHNDQSKLFDTSEVVIQIRTEVHMHRESGQWWLEDDAVWQKVPGSGKHDPRPFALAAHLCG